MNCSATTAAYNDGNLIDFRLYQQTQDRDSANYSTIVTIQKLFADCALVEQTVEEHDPTKRLKSYYLRYQKRLKDETNNAFISRMAFMAEGAELTNQIYYNMVLATKSLSMLNSYKFAGQGMSHEASMLCCTDFFYSNNLPIPHGRQTDAAVEADVIFEAFRGRTVLLGELKRFIIEETPFPFHAKALRHLEKNGKLTEVEPLDKAGNPVDRINKELCHKISKNPDDSDLDGKKFGNFWRLTFAAE